MKYVLKRIENGREVTTVEGDSLPGMQEIVKSSNGLFKEGYVIYEMRPVEYGTPEKDDYDWQDSWALTEDREYYENLMGIKR